MAISVTMRVQHVYRLGGILCEPGFYCLFGYGFCPVDCVSIGEKISETCL